MITKAGKIIGRLMLGGSNRGKSAWQAKNTVGTDLYIYYVGSIQLFNVSTGVYSTGVCIGSGTTPPTENDYYLESIITTATVTMTVTYDSEGVDSNNNAYVEGVLTVRNTGSAEITVSEIGWIGTAYAHVTNNRGLSSKTMSYFLLDRTLLNTPVIIPAGESAAIRYRVTTNMS